MINELTEDSAPQKYPSDSCVKEMLFFFPGGGGRMLGNDSVRGDSQLHVIGFLISRWR